LKIKPLRLLKRIIYQEKGRNTQHPGETGGKEEEKDLDIMRIKKRVLSTPESLRLLNQRARKEKRYGVPETSKLRIIGTGRHILRVVRRLEGKCAGGDVVRQAIIE
jgi:hypothetical protein